MPIAAIFPLTPALAASASSAATAEASAAPEVADATPPRHAARDGASNRTLATARARATELGDLLRRERHAMAAFLIALADFDRRRLWEELGHASLFAFLRRDLKLSAGAAYYRKVAAGLVQRYPDVEASLRDGRLCLSSVAELAKVLTPENVGDVLPRFHGLSSREAALVAVELRPVENAPVRDVITWAGARAPEPSAPPAVSLGTSLPACAASEGARGCEAGSTTSPAAHPPPASASVAPPRASPAVPPTPCAAVDPLDAERARVHLTVSRRFLAKLDAARTELSHALPEATLEEVLERALDELLADREKRRRGPDRPRAPRPAMPGRVTAAVRREVWARAGGACEYPLADGTRCGSTLRLEIDHVEPRALGGGSSAKELRVACAAHNQIAGRRKLGAACMATRRRRRARSDDRRAPASSFRAPELGFLPPSGRSGARASSMTPLAPAHVPRVRSEGSG